MILARLKAETRPYHDAIESQLDLFDHPPSRAAYRSLLLRFWGYYEPMEDRIGHLADWSQLGFDFEERRKTHLLQQDLFEPREHVPEVWSRCPRLPELNRVPQALGCLYVLEGSTLGGQVITRYLKSLPDGPYPCDFFASYGEHVGDYWKAFGVFLTEYSARHHDDDAIVESACATFSTLGAWLAAQDTP